MTATIARLELNPHDPNARAAPSCLLCGSSQYAIDQSLDAEGIFRCWAIEGRRFSDTVRRPLLQEGTIHLYRCRQCGFQFFNPRLAGSSEFYEQIAAGGDDYYAPDRPENERNARYALKRGFRNILDVGCGTGFALDAAKALGLETFGIELNRRAGGIAAGRGHRVFPVLLEEMEPAWEGKFDMISLNQLLEHVPEPVTLIRQCRRFLSSDGGQRRDSSVFSLAGFELASASSFAVEEMRLSLAGSIGGFACP